MTTPIRTLAVLACLVAAGYAHGQSARIVATVSDEHGRPLADAVVVAVPVDQPARLPGKPREDAIFQVDKEFVPRVSVVLAGTAVAFPNNDDVRHHVYSFSPAKRFELPLYQGTPPHPVVFDKPGVVVLGCNIHDWMVAYVYVSESPHYRLTGSDGRAALDDLPPRPYIVRVWHPQLEGDEDATRRTVDLARTKSTEVAWSLRLKPEVRVRRAPATMRGGNY
jgi:plastocyanin